MNEHYSEEEMAWLAEHAHEGRRDVIAARFNTQFNSTRSEKALERLAREAGHPVQTIRKWGRYTEEEKRWIKDNAPSVDCAELAERFNRKFAQQKTPAQMRGIAARLGARTRPRPTPPRASWGRKELEWLKANAEAFSAREASEEILKQFGKHHDPGAVSTVAKRHGLKVASGSLRTPDEVHKAQQTWLSEEVPKHQSWEAATQAFNERFGTTLAMKTLRPCATKVGARPHAVVAPGESALSQQERTWLEQHAHKAGWSETMKVFNQHFESERSTAWLVRHARRAGIECRDGRGRGWERATYWRPDDEARAWLIAQAPTSTCPQLLGLIKVRYDVEIAISTLRVRLKELGVSAKKTIRATPRSAQALVWLEENAGEYGCTELAQHYADEFGVRLTAGALKAACRRLGVRMRTETGGRHHWRSSERAWLRKHAGRMHFETLRRAFNQHFDASVSKHSLKAQLKRLDERARRPPKGFSWGEPELKWLARHAPELQTRALCEAFNKRFDAAIRPASMRARLATLGIRSKAPTKRTLTAHERTWIAQRADECSNSELARRFNEQFNANIYPNRIPLEASRAKQARTDERDTMRNRCADNGTQPTPLQGHHRDNGRIDHARPDGEAQATP